MDGIELYGFYHVTIHIIGEGEGAHIKFIP